MGLKVANVMCDFCMGSKLYERCLGDIQYQYWLYQYQAMGADLQDGLESTGQVSHKRSVMYRRKHVQYHAHYTVRSGQHELDHTHQECCP